MKSKTLTLSLALSCTVRATAPVPDWMKPITDDPSELFARAIDLALDIEAFHDIVGSSSGLAYLDVSTVDDAHVGSLLLWLD
jgi:hypothetical protein